MRNAFTTLILTTALLGSLVAQTVPDAPVPTAPVPVVARKARVLVSAVEELAVPAGEPIPVAAELKTIRPRGGAAETGFYLVAVVSRQILAGAQVSPTDLGAKLTYPKYNRAVLPTAIAVKAAELTDTDAYQVQEKDRYVREYYYFSVTRGQRDWTFECTGCQPKSLLELYVRVHLENFIRQKTVLVRIPDGREVKITTNRTQDLRFPASRGTLEFLFDDGTRIATPWRRFSPGQELFAGFSSGRNAPVLPHEALVNGLAIIKQGYEKYKTQQGKGYQGGGTYDLTPAGQDPVKCVLMFGGPKGTIQSCEDPVTKFIAKFDEKGKVIEYSRRYNSFKVELFDKLQNVSINREATRITGLATIGRYRIEGSRGKPSLWKKGVLQRGVLNDVKRGRFNVKGEQFGDEFTMLYGTKAR